ncbi:MAG: segregation/condensation protein A [Proteobacteria bacterium]|nr:segregation/condensation protein A [Pseudomonadota bacterium]MCK4867129.1 segregation/condensation protein A [Alphaproteobacteria bacterium]
MIADDDTDKTVPDPFEESRPDYDQHDGDRLLLDIEGYEGPIDVLLALARDQKVDLTRISILALAEQYLDFIAQARDLRLELAADYLVMAAWLAYLKSRLLLPAPPGDDEPSGAEMAAMLAFQLQRLGAMKEAGAKLFDRPLLGQAFFRRGETESLKVENRASFEVSLYDILRAYARQHGRQEGATLHIAPTGLYSIEEALVRLRALVGDLPDWTVLSGFLPTGLKDRLLMRSALASTFVATLELARNGQIEIQQSDPYAPVYIRTSRRAK